MRKSSLLRMGTPVLFCAILLIVTIFQNEGYRPAAAANLSSILIEKVHPYALSGKDEAIQLVNVGTEPIDLAGWGVSDNGGKLLNMTFPSDSILAAGERIWLSKSGVEFEKHFGFKPDFEQEDTFADVRDLVGGSWPALANNGDRAVLSNHLGQIIDALVYENSDPTVLITSGQWVGDSLKYYDVGAKQGQIFFRKLDSSSGLPLSDTNSAADWGQDIGDPILGQRVQYPGWVVEQFLEPYQTTETASLTIAIAPDNAFETVAQQFDRAEISIFIETQTFESHDLLEHLKRAVERGVEVKLLLEGGPAGGVDDSQRWNCQQLNSVGGNCMMMQNEPKSKIFDRYPLIHAKFMIIDGTIAVIGSDNLSPNSLPADRKDDGTFGRRGVTLITDAIGVVNHLQTVFADDVDQSNHHDIFNWQPLETTLGVPLTAYLPVTYENGITHTVTFPESNSFSGEFEFEVIQSPENFLNPDRGLLGLLANAGMGDTILVQQQYERLYWGDSIEDGPNLRLQAYLEAARRGAKVEVLLDSYFDNPTSETSNQKTCQWLHQMALEGQLDILCQTGNPTGLGIHNKMVLIEISGRGYVHVGSINGSEQAAKANREMALQVQSDEAYDLLKAMFQQDFKRTVYLPVLFNNYEPPTDQLLISEVLYDPPGSDSAEYIEIVNPSGMLVDISGYSLSDAVNKADFSDLRRFPDGSTIQPGGVLVVTQQAKEFEAQFGFLPDYELLDSDPDVPQLLDDPEWGNFGSQSPLLKLGNSGDAVFLRDQVDNVLDVLVYGNKVVTSYPTCAAVETFGASLRRNPFNYDTDTCADFEEWGVPTPGQAP